MAENSPDGIRRIRSAILPILIIAAWLVADRLSLTNTAILAPPTAVLKSAYDHLTSLAFASTLAISLKHFLIGWVIGLVAGSLIGLFMGLSSLFRIVVSPTFSAIRQVALFAWIPLLTAWLGNGDISRIAFVALATMFPIALNLEIACRLTPVRLLEVGRVLEMSPSHVVRGIILPSCFPAFATGLELSLTAGWVATVGAEYLIEGGNGIGVFLMASREYNDMASVIFAIVVLAVIGLLFELCNRLIARRLLGIQHFKEQRK